MRAVIVVLAGHKHNHTLPYQKKDDFSSLEFSIQSTKEFIVLNAYFQFRYKLHRFVCGITTRIQIKILPS